MSCFEEDAVAANEGIPRNEGDEDEGGGGGSDGIDDGVAEAAGGSCLADGIPPELERVSRRCGVCCGCCCCDFVCD